MCLFLTPEQISAVTSASLVDIQATWPLVCEALDWAGINHPLVQVGAAATIAIETGNFQPVKEIESKTPGSPLYKTQQRYFKTGYFGRGYIQLTWFDNYKAAGRALGLDLLTDPDQALQPYIAAKILAWYLKTRPVSNKDPRRIFEACLASDWNALRRGINGPNFQIDAKTHIRHTRFCVELAKMVSNSDFREMPNA